MLDNSPMIDVAIGLIFFYVTLSLVCSSIQEIIAGLCGLRSRNLKKGIRNLVGNEYAQALYDHPLIKGLRKPKGRPSYIDPEIFSAALMAIVARDKVSNSESSPLPKTCAQPLPRSTPTTPSARCCSAWWTRLSRGWMSSGSGWPRGSTPVWTGSPAGTSAG